MARNEDFRKWNSVLSNRARSMSPLRRSSKSPRSRSSRRRLLAPVSVDQIQNSMGSMVKSWIMTPNMASQQPSKSLFLPQTSALTLLMIKLEETLPLFCETLACPNMENAATAAGLLDNKITTTASSSPSANSVSSSPSSPGIRPFSQIALQSCWETYISPFIFLAAAEVLYMQDRTPKLVALYMKIANDLTVVEQILCDPVASENGYFLTATSLAKQLLALRNWSAFRCRLLELTSQELWIPHVRSGFQDLLRDVTSSVNNDNAMMKSLRSELQLWLSFSEACFNLQDCRFKETILSVRRIKVKLASIHTKTKLHEWFDIALQELFSLMRLYFDRLKTQALSSYGFDPVRLGSPNITTDFDGQVLDFLRKNDSPIAICIVLEDKTNDSCAAMYLRSSLQSMTRSSSSASSLKSRLLLGRREDEVDDILNQDPYKNTQEWPHSEWEDLTAILRNEVNAEELGPAMTFRAKDVDSLPSASTGSTVPDFFARAPPERKSYFHVASLSRTSSLWLVAIVKEDDAASDTGRWNLRIPRVGNSYSEEDIRVFVEDMASKLRIANLVERSTIVQETQDAIVSSSAGINPVDTKPKALSVKDLVLEWTDPKTKEYLGMIKSQFGLRPQSPMIEPLKSPYQLNFSAYGNQKKKKKKRIWNKRERNIEESAAAWFLGPELFKQAKDGRFIDMLNSS